jgi:hypothetical protein
MGSFSWLTASSEIMFSQPSVSMITLQILSLMVQLVVKISRLF